MKIIQPTTPSSYLLSQYKSSVDLDKNSLNQEHCSAPLDTYEHLKESCSNDSTSSIKEEIKQKNTEKTLSYHPIEDAEKKRESEEYFRFYLLINKKETEISLLKKKKAKLYENFTNLLREINNLPIKNRDILKEIKVKIHTELLTEKSSLDKLNHSISSELDELRKQEENGLTETINLLIKKFYAFKFPREKIIAINREINIMGIFTRNIRNNSKYREVTTRRHSMP